MIETPEDVLNIPVAASNAATVTLGSVASILPTFKDATTITRVDGKPAVAIEVSKRAGANLIETVEGVKAAIAAIQGNWPETLQVGFLQDQSKFIIDMLTELQNSVITAVILVAVIILFFLGGRASIFIGIAIPFSFLVGILGLSMAGLTVNIVVLFSLILAVGMLVDDAIIVSEFAERRMSEGMKPREAYAFAASRMSGPVVAATLTRVAAFSPLLFWPGIVGEFMGYMPLTLIATLSASLVAALDLHADARRADRQAARGPSRCGGARGPLYQDRAAGDPPSGHDNHDGLRRADRRADPLRQDRQGRRVLSRMSSPISASVLVHARGNLSLAEKDRLVRAGRGHGPRHAGAVDGLRRSGEMGSRARRRSPRTSSARSSSSSSTGRSGGRPVTSWTISARGPRTFPASRSR